MTKIKLSHNHYEEHSPYSVPKDYFEHMEREVMARADEESREKNVSGEPLSRERKGYRVPADYFSSFTGRMMQRIDNLPEERREESPVADMPETATLHLNKESRPFFVKVRPYLYLAAAFCGLFFCIQVFQSQERGAEEKPVAGVTQETSIQTAEEQYLDGVLDYINMDKADVYACVTSAE